MKKEFRNNWLVLFVLGISSSLIARESPTSAQKSPTKPIGQIQAKGANCAPSTGVLKMSFNNVNTLLQQGGLLYRQVGGQKNAAYEVPKGGGRTVIYAGSLWMGGVDINGQLKLAALTFKERGNDFWPGPLTVSPGSGNYNPNTPVGDDAVRDYGEANIDPDVCLAYDKFFTMRKGEIIRFNLWWECENVPGTEGCEEVQAPTNEEINRINNWPAHGSIARGQDYYLAPFYDRDGDGVYDPNNGDHPWYDDILGRDDIECGIDRRISLFGDETHWWIFNDKGNIHGESNGDPIGMEIRAQAFAFATNDEVNNMTFYNYELINRGTQTLFSTYFSQYMDADVGYAADDYVGCDVSRGLGYAFNGDNIDETNGSQIGYGENPPAVGVDFFEGPYQDADFKDNVGPVYDSVSKTFVSPSVNDAIADEGIVYRGIGTGYSDGLIDNERFGMRRFSYYTGQGSTFPYTDPTSAPQFYNYMSGKWQDGSEMYYGGAGNSVSAGVTTIEADYLFPGDSDPLNWSTAGIDPGFDWDERTNGNPPGDRRFVQSAGPFTLTPGAVNNITVGIVYARGTDGDAFSSVIALKRADTKAQALFDNCFRILSPPDAPRLRIQELENELVLMLDNPASSNNFREKYEEEDKINIVDPGVDRFYRFEGYMIYQLKNVDNAISDINDPSKARLVAQCDLQNYERDANGKQILNRPIARLINFEFDEALGFSIPVEKVAGANKGIQHSFRITEDQFAQGSRTLVNHKTYYYIAVAYAYNNFKTYNPSDPLALDGQKTPFISSRLGFDKKGILPVVAIPHTPVAEAGGTTANPLAFYGATPRITRIDGHGNGGRELELTADSENTIVSAGIMSKPEYDFGKGPINIKVVDPLNVADGFFVCEFKDFQTSSFDFATDTAKWVIKRYASEGGQLLDSVVSETQINVNNEQIIPQWGVSVQINQRSYYFEAISGNAAAETTDLLSSSISFRDSSKRWMEFITDVDGYSARNWIRSGLQSFDNDDAPYSQTNTYNDPRCYPDEIDIDPQKRWTRVLNGGFAPHRLVGYQCDFMPLSYYKSSPSYPGAPEGVPNPLAQREGAGLAFLPSVNIVITPDKSKWTQCPVIELGRDANLNIGGAKPGEMRKSPSKDKNGNNIAGTGMGWFPGYAIDVETGARLYMAFGENSFLGVDGGTDMIWNPSDRLFDATFNPVMGGMQPIYVFTHNLKAINGYSQSYDMGYYNPATSENNNELKSLLESFTGGTPNPIAARNFYSSLAWIGHVKGVEFQDNLATEATIKIRVNKEYKKYSASGENGGKPTYSWNMKDLATRTGDKSTLADVLKLINVVPNPYYAYSEYERNRLDTRVKITNLPEKCEINIFSTNGKLVRSYKKDSQVTSLDWDLNNFKGIPVASGVYLIHVNVPDVGEVVVKFYGGIRQVDLQGI
ncbi:MAG: T9SS type A sorting domain-containing protein [Bacteroidetes bacterium]|nr:T9SS type A sorting domain-containing protein [Bacteroidota bacterium]